MTGICLITLWNKIGLMNCDDRAACPFCFTHKSTSTIHFIFWQFKQKYGYNFLSFLLIWFHSSVELLENELKSLRKQVRSYETQKRKLGEELDGLDVLDAVRTTNTIWRNFASGWCKIDGAYIMWEKGCTNGIRIVKIAHISHDFVGICFNLVYILRRL